MAQSKETDLRGLGEFPLPGFGIDPLLGLPMLLDGPGLDSPRAMLYPIDVAPKVASVVVRWVGPVPKESCEPVGLRFCAYR